MAVRVAFSELAAATSFFLVFYLMCYFRCAGLPGEQVLTCLLALTAFLLACNLLSAAMH
jgi:hypothetical protein